MSNRKADIIASVRLYSKEEGSRRMHALPPLEFGCPMKLKGKYYDCRLLLDQIGEPFELGTCRENIPIGFLDPKNVCPLLIPNDCFYLWEGGIIGEGKINKILIEPMS
jgi:hypothetical protein